MLDQLYFEQDVVTLARKLVGCELVHITPGGLCSGIIVETEAYRQDDEASHSFRGQTTRNSAMFGPGGHAYVYFTYGVHYCFNVVASTNKFAEGVLIRALAPKSGIELMMVRRETDIAANLCNGPGKVAQAMAIGPEHDGASLLSAELHILPGEAQAVATSPRIGITKAADKPWRFFVPDNPNVTKHPFNKAAVLLS